MRFLDDDKRECFAREVQFLVAIRQAKNGSSAPVPSADAILRIADTAREAVQQRPRRRRRPRYVVDNRPKGVLERFGDAVDDGFDRLFGFK